MGRWRSSPASTLPSTRAHAWWCSASAIAGKTTLLKISRASRSPTWVSWNPDGCKIGYFAQEHDTLDDHATVWRTSGTQLPDAGEQDLRGSARCVHGVHRTAAGQPAGTLSGGERRLVWRWPVSSRRPPTLLLDEPTNNTSTRSPRAGARRAAPCHRGGRPGHPRPGAAAALDSAARDPAARRHRGPLERRVPGTHRTRLTAIAGQWARGCSRARGCVGVQVVLG